MHASAAGGRASDDDERSVVWRAIVAYTGDRTTAEELLVLVRADDEPHDRQAVAERWRRVFDRCVGHHRDEVAPSIELLTSPVPGLGFDGGTDRLSETLVSLASVPDRQRRAVIAKHICGLADSQVAELLEAPAVETMELIGQAEAILAGDSILDDRRELLEPVDVTTARRLDPLNRLPLPATAMPGEPGGDGRRPDLSTALAVVAVAAVAGIGLLLVVGSSDVVQSPLAEQDAAPPAPATDNSTPSIAEQEASESERLAAQAELQQTVQGPDRSQEISVSPLGEIVRRDLQSGDEIWRTSPLGEIELSSIDLNTVTVSKGGLLLRVSLTDGTFLPP